MAFDSKYYLKAESEISSIRNKNSRLIEMRTAEICSKFPDIAALKEKLSGTSAQLLKLIADRSVDISHKLDLLEKENIFVQDQIRRALVSHGYPENYLDPVYDCPLCRDTGLNDGKRCTCFMDKVKRAAAADINRTSPMKLNTFDTFELRYYDDSAPTPAGVTARKVMAYNLEACRKYAENFHLPYGSLIMRGKTGLGKTHLSLSIVSEVISKGYNAIYGSAPDIFKMINQEYYGKSSEDRDTLGLVVSADLLVLDDVGAEFDSQFYHSMLYTIINDRTNCSRPTVISTNLEHKELEARYGERTFSRISTMEELIFYGSDVRVRRAAEQQQ